MNKREREGRDRKSIQHVAADLSLLQRLKFALLPSFDAFPFSFIFLLCSPHSAIQADFYDMYLAFVSQGYAVLFPNYAGSLGYGQQALASLPGAVGTNDVGDVMALLDACLEQGYGDRDQVVVFGGSHGGFLAAHLTGQHPGACVTGRVRGQSSGERSFPVVSPPPLVTLDEALFCSRF